MSCKYYKKKLHFNSDLQNKCIKNHKCTEMNENPKESISLGKKRSIFIALCGGKFFAIAT